VYVNHENPKYLKPQLNDSKVKRNFLVAMFGSAFEPSSLLFSSNANQRNLTLTTVKRKRNEEADDPFTSILKMNSGRSFIRRFPLPDELNELLKNPSIFCQFLRSGDLLVISSENISIYREFYDKMKEAELPPPVVYAFPSLPAIQEIKFIDCYIDYFPRTKICRRKELFLITENGLIIFIDLLNDSFEPLIQRIHLINDNSSQEKLISFQLVSDQHLLLLSSFNEIYLIERQIVGSYGNGSNNSGGGGNRFKMTADKLVRPSNMFLNFLQTGMKSLFGFSSSNSAVPSSPVANRLKYSQIIAIPSTSLAFTIGNYLTLWGDYASPGNEKILYEKDNFADWIKSDIRRYSKSYGSTNNDREVKISFLQMENVSASENDNPTEEMEESSSNNNENNKKRILLLFLTASSETKTFDSESSFESQSSIWVHLVEILLITSSTSGETQQQFSSEEVGMTILHRSFVTNEAMLSISPTRALTLNPRIYPMLPLSWRVFVSWISFSTKSLQCLQMDVFHQISKAKEERGNTGFSDFKDFSSDSQIDLNFILSLNYLDFVDGICGVVSGSDSFFLHFLFVLSNFFIFRFNRIG
jgi:hypothetical protein